MLQNSNLIPIAKAYTVIYAICYIISPILGLQVTGIDPKITTPILLLIGASLIYCTHSRNQYILYFLCALETVGCVAHFLKTIPWIPTFSEAGYLIMSLLDLCQAVFLYLMIKNSIIQ